MTIPRTALSHLIAGLLLCALAAATAAPAYAVYGELGHFGESGVGKGQFNLSESNGLTDGLGVDQANNDVYVVDGPTKKEFRIQKFELTSGKWTQVGERKFKPASAVARVTGIQGIAVDHAHDVVYVLVVSTRSETTTVDPEAPAASALYAFTASTLAPATGTTEGLLVGQSTFQPFSDAHGASLLDPRGIAVDPTTGDVVALAYEDPTGEAEPLDVTLQRIHSTGAFGARWRDETSFFSGGAEEVTPEATSPVVSSAGNVYVIGGELPFAAGVLSNQIDEIPSSFAAKSRPKAVANFFTEGLLTFPGLPYPLNGDGLALGSEGNFYAYAQVERQGGVSHPREPAVIAFGPTGTELGWFGGQNQPAEGPHVPCAISFRGEPLVAAGSEGRVFVFDDAPEAPDIVEFGPGGTGCPTPTATVPVASVGGVPLSGAAKAGAPVHFASAITQANALSVEWQFTNTATHASETVSGPPNEFQSPEITHAFSAEASYQVTETIVTDDLASAPLVEKASIAVEASPPKAQLKAPLRVEVGKEALFDAKNSASEGSPITAYKWSFGDGTGTSTATPSVSHVYSSTGSYQVTVEVQNAKGASKAEATVEVFAPEAGGGGGGGATTPTPPPSGGPPPAGTANVLSYSATIAGSSLTVTKAGALVLKIDCSGQSVCAGTVTLRTQSAVAAKRKAILTLASASFTAAGGTVKAVTLHLSAKARALLARVHTLKAIATVSAHDSAGGAHTLTAGVTLRAAKGHGKH